MTRIAAPGNGQAYECMDDQAILELRNISKDYPGVRALDRASMDFRKGEIHGLVGENGAGKSTLIKILAGIITADRGTIFLHGKQQKIASGRDARHLGLSFIHQERNLISYFNCAENIFLGHPYPKTAWGTISWRTLKHRTLEILQRLDATDIPLNVPVKQLAPGEQAVVAIARAFAESASIYCMDEPTTSLTEHEKYALFSVIRNLRATGATIMYISHDLDDVKTLTDRVTIMRDGNVVGTWETAVITKEEIIRNMIGRDMSSALPSEKTDVHEVVLSVSGLSGERVREVSFDLHKGEILGIAGLLGSGRTEILQMIYGVSSMTQGTLTLCGQEFRPASPKSAIKKGVVLVPEERRSQGLILDRSVYENISLVYLDSLSNGLFLNRTIEKRAAESIGRSVKLKVADYDHQVHTLSGGNQQKVVFAKSLLRQPVVLMLDDPTRGVDIGARFEIYALIREMAEQGAAVLLVSSDFSELLELSDRMLILYEGRQILITENKKIDQETLLNYCYGKVR
jgi:ribose transport system ATP-binding protein